MHKTERILPEIAFRTLSAEDKLNIAEADRPYKPKSARIVHLQSEKYPSMSLKTSAN